METEKLKLILEAAILAAGEPVNLERLRDLFDEEVRPSKEDLRNTLNEMQLDFATRGIELKEVASGFCFQAKAEFAPWVKRLWAERVPRYSRALLETLALIAYRQPITRGEIEDIRGVVVSSNIIKTLLENEWVHSVGQREVPGRPSLYATTKQFLDHFNLKSLAELPVLVEPQNLEALTQQLEQQAETTEVAETVDVTEISEITENEEATQETEEVAQEIEEVMQETEEVAQEIEEVMQETEEVAQETEEVAQETEEVAQETEEVAQETEEVAQETEELMQETEEVTQETETEKATVA